MARGLLAGITVLSLEQATTLPFLTYRLACDGARVIRVENAERPDPNRFVGHDVLGEPAMRSYFLPNNCGKEAITLNLGHPDGQALLRALIVKLGVDVSMLRSAVSWMVAPIALSASLGERVARKGNRHQFFAPVAVHRTRDGHVYLAVGNDQQWAALTALPRFAGLGRPEYAANAGRIADVDGLDRALADCFADLGTGEALESLRRAGVPVSRVSTLADVVADPLVAERLMQVTDPRSGLRIALPAPPVGEPPALSFPPRLGEHNEKIYGEALGLAPERLAELRRRQIV